MKKLGLLALVGVTLFTNTPAQAQTLSGLGDQGCINENLCIDPCAGDSACMKAVSIYSNLATTLGKPIHYDSASVQEETVAGARSVGVVFRVPGVAWLHVRQTQWDPGRDFLLQYSIYDWTKGEWTRYFELSRHPTDASLNYQTRDENILRVNGVSAENEVNVENSVLEVLVMNQAVEILYKRDGARGASGNPGDESTSGEASSKPGNACVLVGGAVGAVAGIAAGGACQVVSGAGKKVSKRCVAAVGAVAASVQDDAQKACEEMLGK